MKIISPMLLALIAFSSLATADDNDRGNVSENSATEAHDEATVRTAVARAVSLLEQASAGTAENRVCFTCHGQALPVMALAEAKLRGFAIDEANFQRQLDHALKHLKRGKKDYLAGKGQGGRVDTAGYALWTLEAGNCQPNEITDAVIEYLLQTESDDGHWKRSSNRPPSEASDFTTTYLALRALSVFGSPDHQPRITERNEAARRWLLEHEPSDTEDRVFHLRAASYVGIDDEALQRLANELLSQQRDDGGWAQNFELNSDAYATGSVLTSLLRTGYLTPTSPAYRRGIDFLLQTQHEDGSWHVVSRSKPFQKYFETSFPHGKDQFISTSATAWSTIALLLTMQESEPRPPTKPNIFLFLVDDMGWMDSEPYGSKYYQTPNMSRLAKQSMRFTDAYALPLCSPTRASILTGQYSSRHGVTSASGHQPPQPSDFQFLPETAPPNQPWRMPISKNYLDPAHYTLAEALRDAGYRTAHFGKWHLGLTAPHRPDKHGFEVTWHCAPDPGPPNYFSPYGVHPDGRPSGQHKVGNITDGPEGEHITDRLTDEAIAFIKRHQEEPFYLNLWHYSVHGPWQHKEEYTAEFAKTTDPRGEQNNPVMASMLQNVDESLGRILDTLEELGIADNTLFIFYSDNGGNTHSWRADDPRVRNLPKTHRLYETVRSYRKWAGDNPPTNNAPLREGKGRIYEGGQRVPLMVRWPGHVQPGTTSDAIVGPIDIYPTIVDALGLPLPTEQTIDGESFIPVLEQTGRLDRTALFTWFPHLIPAVSVRQGDWKLIRRFQPHRDYPDIHELYDLKNDIGETTNLAAKMPGKVRQLDALIDRFVKETGALYPQPNPKYEPEVASAGARDPGAGLVPKFCKATLIDGALRVEADGRSPFLGTAQVRLSGPLKLKLRIRSQAGGSAKIRWKMPAQDAFPEAAQVVSFDVKGGGQWQDITVDLPIQGKPQLVRLYVPATKSPVDIQLIQYTGNGTAAKTWNFDNVKP